MKVAIPTNDRKGLDSAISPEFSTCRFFILSDLEGDRIASSEFIAHELPGPVKGVTGAVAFLLAGQGVEAAVVQRIGDTDRLALAGNGIRVYAGARGTVFDALRQLIDGRLEEDAGRGSGESCGCGGDRG